MKNTEILSKHSDYKVSDSKNALSLLHLTQALAVYHVFISLPYALFLFSFALFSSHFWLGLVLFDIKGPMLETDHFDFARLL